MYVCIVTLLQFSLLDDVMFWYRVHRIYNSGFVFAGVSAAEPEAIDPYELIEAVDILSKLPKDFFENLVSVFADRELQWNVSFYLAT